MEVRNLLISFVLLLASGTIAGAQSCNPQNHFSGYTPTDVVDYSQVAWNTSTGMPSGSISFTRAFTYSGYTSGCVMPYPQVYHWVKTRIRLSGEILAFDNGHSGCSSCQLSGTSYRYFTHTLGAAPFDILTEEDASTDCSSIGLFGSWTSWLDFEVAFTASYNTGNILSEQECPSGQEMCTTWGILPNCTAESSPPDWDPNDYNAPSRLRWTDVYYVFGVAACVRINISGTPWLCTPGASIGLPSSLNLGKYSCTNKDKGTGPL
jgi:hypothetical protein